MQIVFPDPNFPTFSAPDPDCEEEVDDEVDDAGVQGGGFGSFPAEFVIETKSGGSDGNGGVAEGETDVREGVGLSKGQGGDDGGKRVVGGGFEVYIEVSD